MPGAERLTIATAAHGLPAQGERNSGDAMVVQRRDSIVFLAIVDGLGHGDRASEVAAQAASYLESSWSLDLPDTLNRLHQELAGSRGAVAGLCAIDAADGSSRFSGIGDTGAVVIGAEQSLFSKEGILGSRIRTPQVQRFVLEPGAIVVLHTDGVSHDFQADLPRDSRATAAELAHDIVEEHRRPHDDATCVVAIAAAA
ncbi:MAG: SpoIIE family protein phosphatase [Solirubrobacterales bacterium]